MNHKLELYQKRKNNRQKFDTDDFLERSDESSYGSEDENDGNLNEMDEEQMKKFSKFNFSGMSFKDYVKNEDKPNLG